MENRTRSCPVSDSRRVGSESSLDDLEYMLMSREIITDLASMAKAHYAMFQKTTGKLPNKVVMFRDGVSEGQYAHVVE